MDAVLASRLLEILGSENAPKLLINSYPRIAERVAQMWGREALVVFLNELLFLLMLQLIRMKVEP